MKYKNGRKNKPKATAQPSYKMTLIAVHIILRSPTAIDGQMIADVTYDGRTVRVPVDITHEGRLQLHCELPEWLANIVADWIAERWPDLRNATMEDLIAGRVVPEPMD